MAWFRIVHDSTQVKDKSRPAKTNNEHFFDKKRA